MSYVAVLLRVFNDWDKARSELLAENSEEFKRALNTYFTLNKQLISEIYGVTR